MKFKHWIKAFRLRTLFLSLSCIWAGLICSQLSDELSLPISVLTLSTALFLQILSNLANDYGDSIHGADHAGRKGPMRAVQSGVITAAEMKRALILSAALSFVSGCFLLWFSKDIIGSKAVLILLGTGILSIVAAIAYTNGKRPYGYMGLGDISVFIFFGLVAVMGSQYLQTASLSQEALYLSVAFGLLSVGVLNLNNMRDIESDRTAGKNSIPVRLGLAHAKKYHAALLMLALIFLFLFNHHREAPFWNTQMINLLLLINLILAMKAKDYASFDPLLKWLSLSTFVITLLIQLSL